MPDSNGRYRAALRGLGLAGAALASLLVAALVWQAGASTSAMRERAYPIPGDKCEQSKDCDERALQIQAREAVTADAAMDIALGQLALSVLGIAGVGFTVFYARLAWREAQRSAAAAEGALEGSARSFVFVESHNLTPVDGGSLFTVTWKNSGTTPALRARNQVNWSIFDPDIPEDFGFPDLGEIDRPPFFIGPLSQFHSQPLPIPGEQIDRAAAKAGVIYVWGWIEYDDTVGGRRRRTEFCSRFDVRPLDDVLDETGRQSKAAMIGFPTYKRHNAVDDDCMKKPQDYG